MAAFNIDLELRSHLNLGTQMDVDFRAACFLSGKVINTGYVCSVCLCIMSTIPSDGRCPLCDTEFDEAGLVNLKKKPVVVVKKKKKKRKIDNAIDKSAPGTPINM